jgi:hypothetical protein
VGFYEDLISLVPDDILLYIIVNNGKAVDRLEKLFPERKKEIILIKGFYEPWMRDIMGFNSKDFIIKPRYRPDYYQDVYTPSYLKK